jgi:hypothetical protein
LRKSQHLQNKRITFCFSFDLPPVDFMLQAILNKQLKAQQKESFQCNFLYSSRFLYT